MVEEQPLRLTVMLTSNRPPVEVETSAGRELAIVLSHTIRHNALIGAMTRLLGILSSGAVELARDWVDMVKYVQNQPAAILVQAYHPGPYEAGIFY